MEAGATFCRQIKYLQKQTLFIEEVVIPILWRSDAVVSTMNRRSPKNGNLEVCSVSHDFDDLGEISIRCQEVQTGSLRSFVPSFFCVPCRYFFRPGQHHPQRVFIMKSKEHDTCLVGSSASARVHWSCHEYSSQKDLLAETF